MAEDSVYIPGCCCDRSTDDHPIQCPDIDEQRVLVAFLNQQTARMDVLVSKITEAIERLKEFRTALISAVVTGKIDIREETTS